MGPGRREGFFQPFRLLVVGADFRESTRQKASCNPVSFVLVLRQVKDKPQQSNVLTDGQCAATDICPLSRVKAGSVVCVKRLTTPPEVTGRLRELGFREDQHIKVLASSSNFICQVCNARLGLSPELAETILVQKVPGLVPVR